jgi:dTMP kinase
MCEVSGRFITFEGIDGAGKSSHVPFVAEQLRARGYEVVTTREPGGTPLGEDIRRVVLNQTMHGDTEALLVFASRREHLAAVIEPALARGAWVVCDRFTDSTYAYQCGGRGLAIERVAPLEALVHGDLQPHLTLLFDAPVATAQQRVAAHTPEPDKFEREETAFFSRVRDAYLVRAALFPQRIRVINSARAMEDIRADIAQHIDALIASATKESLSRG